MEQELEPMLVVNGYTGIVSDPSGLSYDNARYYDGAVGQFTTADPVQGPNRYGYVAGNQETYTNPTGQRILDGDNQPYTEQEILDARREIEKEKASPANPDPTPTPMDSNPLPPVKERCDSTCQEKGIRIEEAISVAVGFFASSQFSNGRNGIAL
jgi:RHS repeat-associated protein